MMTDYEAITALLFTYAERLDNGDLEGVADLFARASLGSAGFDERRRGRDEVLQLYRTTVALYDGKPCTKHLTTNVIVDIADDRRSATARSYFTVLQARPELPLQPIVSGRYEDRFVCEEGAWRFDERMMFVDLLGDLRFHLKWDPFAS